MAEDKKVYIIEDNGLNRASLESVLEANDFKIVGSKPSAEAAWDDLQKVETDIVLIDIHLAGERDGIWLAEKIRAHKTLPFIYLTAYGDAKTIKKIRNTNPNGYLMKPYNTPTLLTTIQIAIESFKQKSEGLMQESLRKIIYIKHRNSQVKLIVSDIEYIKSDGNYILIHLKDKKYLVRSKLLDFHKELQNDNFKQVHQRYLINFEKISSVGNNYVQINTEKLPVSKRYKDSLISFLNDF